MKIIIKAGKGKSKIELPRDKVKEMYDKILMVINFQKFKWKTEIQKENEAPPAVSSPPKRKPCTLPPKPPQEVHVTVSDVECPYKHPAYRSPELFSSKK